MAATGRIFGGSALARGLLLVSAVGCGGGAGSTPRHMEAPSLLLQPSCSRQERELLACQELGRAVLHGFHDGAVGLQPSGCSVGLSVGYQHFARLTWRSKEVPGFVYSAVVTLDEQNDDRSLVASSIDPLLFEWPCPEESDCEAQSKLPPGLSVSVAPIPACEGAIVTDPKKLELDLPPASADSCQGVSTWLGVRPSDWCSRGEVQDTRYRVTQWSWFVRPQIRVRLSKRRGAWKLAPPGKIQPWQALEESMHREFKLRLDGAFWTLPTEIAESCRDGGPFVVAGRRPGGWRVVERGCRDIAGTSELIRKLRAQAHEAQSPSVK